MNTNYPLTLEQFKSWLTSKHPQEIVGITRTIDCCPAVNFFKECTYYGGSVEVDGYITETEEGVVYCNPSWLLNFILSTDDASDKELTAKQALMYIE